MLDLNFKEILHSYLNVVYLLLHNYVQKWHMYRLVEPVIDLRLVLLASQLRPTPVSAWTFY